MKPISLLLFLAGFTQALFAQYTINGRIADGHDSGVPFANVLLLKIADSTLVKGAVSDQDGNYNFSNVSRGDFILQSYSVGFAKSYSPEIEFRTNSVITMNDIILKEDSKELEEVVIKAEKPLYEQTIDRMVVNVQSSPIMAGNSVMEVLERSPGVIVDRQNFGVRMNGKSGVSVMINGKMTRMDMTALFGMLDGMPASNVEKIELITTPPANFDAEGNAGFINIVLKRNDYEGLNGGISAMIGRGRRAQFMTGGNINYRHKKINVFADMNFNYNRRHMIFEVENEIDNQDYIFNSTARADRYGGFNLSTGRAGIDFYVSPKTVIGFLGTFFIRDWSQNTDNQAYYNIEPGIDTLVAGIRIDANPRKQFMANINLQHQFDDRQQLNIDFDYFIYSSDQFQTYSNEYFLENGQSISTEDIRIDKVTPLNILVGKLDYTFKATDAFTLEAGIKATISDLENDIITERLEGNDWQADPLFSDFSTMDEDILAAYSSISTKLSEKLSLKAGLRYEHTTTDLKDEDGRQVVYRDYGYFFPSAFLSQKLTENSALNLAYSYRISRPSFSEMAPFVLFIEPKTFATGNTNLLPALTHALKTTYTIKNINISFEYNRIKDAFARFQPTRIPETNSTILSTVNLDQTDMFNLTLSLPVTVTSWWEMNNNISGISSHVTSIYYDEPMDVSQTWYSLMTTQSFVLPQKFSVELSGMYYSGRLSGISKRDPYGMVSIGVRKELGNNGGILNLNFSDMFRTMIIRSSASTPQYSMNSGYSLDFDNRAIKLTYTKSFGNNKLKSRSKRKTGSADDLKRVGN